MKKIIYFLLPDSLLKIHAVLCPQGQNSVVQGCVSYTFVFTSRIELTDRLFINTQAVLTLSLEIKWRKPRFSSHSFHIWRVLCLNWRLHSSWKSTCTVVDLASFGNVSTSILTNQLPQESYICLYSRYRLRSGRLARFV